MGVMEKKSPPGSELGALESKSYASSPSPRGNEMVYSKMRR